MNRPATRPTRKRSFDSSKQNERVLIGSALLDLSVTDRLPDIRQEHFADPVLGKLWTMARELNDGGHKSDIVLIRGEIEKRGIEIPSADLLKLFSEVPSTAHARFYADNVSEAARLRAIGEIVTDAANSIQDATRNSSSILADLDGRLETLRAGAASEKCQSIGETARQIVADLDKPASQIMAATGLYLLDDTLGGLRAGEMVVIAARPGCGKSSLAMQTALHNAEKGRPVLFVSLEMTARELVARTLAGDARISATHLRLGDIEQGERKELEQAANRVLPFPLTIADPASASLAYIRAVARSHKARGGLSLLVIDYLSLIQPADRRQQRWEQVSDISRSIKRLAKELACPIIALQQLNRDAADKAPQLSHLRESGSIEQDADSVVLLHLTGKQSDQIDAQIIVAKNRHGQTGKIKAVFDATRTRFE